LDRLRYFVFRRRHRKGGWHKEVDQSIQSPRGFDLRTHFSGRQSVRFSYFDTTLARLGGNTQSFGVAYQFLWATGR
jgi:hypothetical protein